jgi:hypothetical protein
MWVVKASGETEKFDSFKIRRTCLRAGASEELSDRIAKEVKKKAYNGITTKAILEMTIRILSKEKPHVAARYDLKGAMFRLGPAGFVFENFVGEVLKEYGYSVKVHNIIRGHCVSHEIDVVAEKDNKSYMIECKFHNMPGIYTNLKEALYTYARFMDLEEGSHLNSCQNFDQPWLVCNTKFSDDAIQYSKCRGLNLIGWSYPEGDSLESMIEAKKLYPITMLRSLDRYSMDKLASADFILALDLLRIPLSEISKLTKISVSKLRTFSQEAEGIMQTTISG